MKKLYMYATATIIAMLPMIMLIAYMTYTEKIVLPIYQDLIVRPVETEVGTGLMIPTFFGKQEITKKAITYVPDYEKTNIAFAHLITETILSKAKELGEITKIELTPTPVIEEKGKRFYRLYVYSNVIKIEENIEVLEHYGECNE